MSLEEVEERWYFSWCLFYTSLYIKPLTGSQEEEVKGQMGLVKVGMEYTCELRVAQSAACTYPGPESGHLASSHDWPALVWDIKSVKSFAA